MRLTSVLSLALLVTSLAACNTFNGMGQDISSAGQGLSKGATHAKEKMDQSEYNNTTQYNYPNSTTSAHQPSEQDYQATPSQQNY